MNCRGSESGCFTPRHQPIGQMLAVRRIVHRALLLSGHFFSPNPSSIATFTQGSMEQLRWRATAISPPLRTLASPWAAIQRREAKVLGSDVRTGNVIQRKGRVYQVLKAQHTQHGRGGATIQVELRDIDSGSKVTERFRTDEVLEEVLVEDKSLTVLYQEGDMVTLMDPSTFEQLEVSKDLFGKNASYLKEEMNVTVQCYDGKPTSASVPQRLTCTVVDAQPHSKGLTASPQYKRVVLDNGLIVMVPPFIEAGDEIVLNSTEDKYLARAKE